MRFEDLAVGPEPQLPLHVYDARRRRVAEALGDQAVLVVATHPLAVHSNDVEHRFRPQSDFWYLTGFSEPGAILVLIGGTAESHLFLRVRKPEAEIWTGRRLGVERARDALDVDHAYALEEFPDRFHQMIQGLEVHAIVKHHPEIQETVRNAVRDTLDGQAVVAAFRCIKDADEIKLLQRANDVGIAAQEAIIAGRRSLETEYAMESELLRVYRANGSTGPAYPPIVGAASNAAVLHYIDNQAPIGGDDLILVDAGCEWGYYNSDITRTFPAKAWSSLQKELYGIVLDAQKAAIAEVRPGNRFRDPHDAAVQVLTQGLIDQGIIDGDVDAAIESEAYRAHFMHGTSHFLGLDVHDVGDVKGPDGESRVLEPGMVLTIEPGLYFNPDFSAVPDGIPVMGLRIENDVVVTDDGCLDLTADLATDPDELEAMHA